MGVVRDIPPINLDHLVTFIKARHAQISLKRGGGENDASVSIPGCPSLYSTSFKSHVTELSVRLPISYRRSWSHSRNNYRHLLVSSTLEKTKWKARSTIQLLKFNILSNIGKITMHKNMKLCFRNDYRGSKESTVSGLTLTLKPKRPCSSGLILIRTRLSWGTTPFNCKRKVECEYSKLIFHSWNKDCANKFSTSIMLYYHGLNVKHLLETDCYWSQSTFSHYFNLI